MITLEYFEKDAREARAILEAMGCAATAQCGERCVFSLVGSLTREMEEDILALEQDAFGAAGVAFDRLGLDEVRSDPDALFLILEVNGKLQGCCFGYWEWPDQITVAGTDFFLDTAMVSRGFRGHGIGRVSLAGVLLLVRLLECHRVGIAAWRRGPIGNRLVDFYRGFGFEKVESGRNPHALMALDLDRAPTASWRRTLGLIPGEPAALAPPMGRGSRTGRIWPREDERALVGRLYLAVGLSEALCFVTPFQFAYLYLVMAKPQWAVLPMIVATAAALVTGIPAGAIADRWSRKWVVLGGAAASAAGMAAIPFAVVVSGRWQVVLACAAFALVGVGETLMGAASEAWVVDNLHAAGRRDLIDIFYARVRSIGALGAAFAAAAALILLLTSTVDRALLNILWFVAAAGFLLSAGLAATVPEHRMPHEAAGDEGQFWLRLRGAVGALAARPALLYTAVAIVLASLSGVVSDDAFVVALITKGLDAKMLAPLNIADHLIGIAGPLIAVRLARFLGATRLLSLFLALEALAVTVLLANRSLMIIVALYVVLDFLDDVWDPVALARLQLLMPSSHRATIMAAVQEFSALAQLLALGAFALMLGRHSKALEAATPDLVEAFSGHAPPPPHLPAVFLGLPVPELAIVMFIAFGLLALPFIAAARKAERAPG